MLWSVMTWRIYQDFKSDLISSSLEFVNQDLASLQREMVQGTDNSQLKHFRKALSGRGVNTRYKVLAAIDEKGYILHATQLVLTSQEAINVLPNFDLKRFTKVQQMNRADIHVDYEHQQINAYFPLILTRHADEIRPSNIGVLLAVYDLSRERIKILDRVKNSGLQIGLLLFFVMIFLLVIINYYITRPIQQLVLKAAAIANGKPDIRSPFHGLGELAILDQAFNKMNEILDARFKEQNQSEEKLRQHKDNLEKIVLQRTEELTKANENLKKLSEIDPLTKVFNRRVYENRLVQEVTSAKRSEQPLSLMMIDIDFFKNYNDHYGHDAGDIALKFVAQTIKETVPRKTDLTARFGGEEFVVLMPATNSQGAYLVAENIRANIKALAIKHEYSEVINMITVSIGISSLSGEALNEEDLFKQADLALYASKEAGRNRCEIYS